MAAAGFLGLHALATPGVLLDAPNTGFVVATPVGLLAAACFAAASALDLSPQVAAAIMRRQRAPARRRAGRAGRLGGGLARRDSSARRGFLPERAEGPLVVAAIAGVALYAFAAVRYLPLYRRRRTELLARVGVAFVLLAEAMVAVAFGRNWHASWWEWHVLMAVAFGLVAYAARRSTGARRSVRVHVHAASTSSRRSSASTPSGRPRSRSWSRAPEGRRTSCDERDGLAADEAEAARAGGGGDQAAGRALPALPLAAARRAPARRPERRRARRRAATRSACSSPTSRASPPSPSERARREVIAMLNRYWAGAVPVLDEEGGVIERFAGDAMMVVFNAARRPAGPRAHEPTRAALALQRAAGEIAEGGGLAALPRRHQHGACGRRQRRQRRAAQLHRDRRHDEPRVPPPDARPSRARS